MEAHGLEAKEQVPASRKLGKDRARELAKSASRVVVIKGKVVKEAKGAKTTDLVDSMLGPTGNLRAPTLVAGKTVLVGFNEEIYEEILL